ncbi:uncharacterized protein [Littorina saxatilis]|uniref:uncharacterized protein n=1 Tax=Littorina saxatilis TaxID=31220 RepID=UPI0038B5D3A5
MKFRLAGNSKGIRRHLTVSPSTRSKSGGAASGAAPGAITSTVRANRKGSPSNRLKSGPGRKPKSSNAYANTPNRETYSSPSSRGDSKHARGDSSHDSRPETSDSEDSVDGDDNRSTAKKKPNAKKKAKKPGAGKGKGKGKGKDKGGAEVKEVKEVKEEPPKQLTSGQKCKVCCSTFFGIAITMVLTTFYSIGGAYLFVHLELPYELQVRHNIGQVCECVGEKGVWEGRRNVRACVFLPLRLEYTMEAQFQSD